MRNLPFLGSAAAIRLDGENIWLTSWGTDSCLERREEMSLSYCTSLTCSEQILEQSMEQTQA